MEFVRIIMWVLRLGYLGFVLSSLRLYQVASRDNSLGLLDSMTAMSELFNTFILFIVLSTFLIIIELIHGNYIKYKQFKLAYESSLEVDDEEIKEFDSSQ